MACDSPCWAAFQLFSIDWSAAELFSILSAVHYASDFLPLTSMSADDSAFENKWQHRQLSVRDNKQLATVLMTHRQLFAQIVDCLVHKSFHQVLRIKQKETHFLLGEWHALKNAMLDWFSLKAIMHLTDLINAYDRQSHRTKRWSFRDVWAVSWPDLRLNNHLTAKYNLRLTLCVLKGDEPPTKYTTLIASLTGSFA